MSYKRVAWGVHVTGRMKYCSAPCIPTALYIILLLLCEYIRPEKIQVVTLIFYCISYTRTRLQVHNILQQKRVCIRIT